MTRQRTRSICSRLRGFTLVEILVVLVIVGILLAMAMVITRGISAAQKRSLTATRISSVDAALVQYVMANKRLPCPADGTVATGAVGAGTALGGGAAVCTGDQLNGVVPWVALGMSESDATDGWDRRLTYRVAAPLAATDAMDMSFCDPAGTNTNPVLAPGAACNAACVSTDLGKCTPPSIFLANRGLAIQTVTGAPQMIRANGTGAAYVVISAGESGGGVYLNSGQLGSTTTTDGTQEKMNYADRVVQETYTDDGIADVADNNIHFDDLVSRPSVQSVITKAALGPRSH